MSEQTGGRYFRVDKQHPLQQIFDQIQAEMRSQYSLAFVSSDERKDGRYRRIEVFSRQPGLRIQARQGYYAATHWSQASYMALVTGQFTRCEQQDGGIACHQNIGNLYLSIGLHAGWVWALKMNSQLTEWTPHGVALQWLRVQFRSSAEQRAPGNREAAQA